MPLPPHRVPSSFHSFALICANFFQLFSSPFIERFNFPMASAGKDQKSHRPYLQTFKLIFLCFEQLEMPNKKNKLIQMRLLSAMTKRHVQDLSASLPLPQTLANRALTFDSLHSRSSNKSWRLRNLSSKLKSRPTERHHSSNLKLCRCYQKSTKVQTLVSPWHSLITMLE